MVILIFIEFNITYYLFDQQYWSCLPPRQDLNSSVSLLPWKEAICKPGISLLPAFKKVIDSTTTCSQSGTDASCHILVG